MPKTLTKQPSFEIFHQQKMHHMLLEKINGLSIMPADCVRLTLMYLSVSSAANMCSSRVNEEVSEDIIDLMHLTGVPISSSRNLAEVVHATQKSWIRPPQKERAQLENSFDTLTRERIFEICSTLGYITEVKPFHRQYDYCCIHGGLMQRMINRLKFAEQLCTERVKFTNLILLAGDRELDEHDKTPEFPNFPHNEIAGMKLAYLMLSGLENLRKLPYILVETGKVRLSADKWVRPGTSHTLREWMDKHDTQSGSCLFISNQPYVLYQHAIAEAELPASFSCETVGAGITSQADVVDSVLLDTVARSLYQQDLGMK